MLELKKIRKDLHRIPEIAFHEFKTQEYILACLRKYSGLQIHTFETTGILVEYSNGSGKYQLFRADMDALPISEETGCDFASEHGGYMHACGHDIHMTILLGLVEKVVNEQLEQNILFFFQPAEEGAGGAERLLQNSIWDKFPISNVHALHVNGKLPVGTISTKPGIFFANTVEVDVIISGKSSHVAFPEAGKDALKGGMLFLTYFAEEIKMWGKTDVAWGFGHMTAGRIRNAIAANCKLEGTYRAFNHENRNRLKDTTTICAKKVETALGVSVEIKYLEEYEQVENNPELVNKLKKVTSNLDYEYDEAEQVFTGEDFGFFTIKFPGILFWLGAKTPDMKTTQDLHASNFLPDDDCIEVGINAMWGMIER